VNYFEHLTIFVHVDIKTFFQSAGPALVSVYLIDWAIPLSIRSAASITAISADTSLEEATAAITGIDSVMFP